MRPTSTVRVAGRLVRVDPRAYGHAWLLWVGFHCLPIPIGLAVKLAFDRIEGGGAVWTALAAVAGLEAARWVLLVVAAVQFHGAWMGWLTVPR
jgi:ATP-binding cassette subfamily B protein